jgi:hypothetical protein
MLVVTMYTTEQYVEMILLFGQCKRNVREAARQYAIKFPNDIHPSTNAISNVVKRFRETGSVVKRPQFKSSKMPICDEEVLGYALAYPQSSVRDISEASGCSKSHVWNVLNVHGAHPYRPLLVQEFLPGDEDRRFDFSNFIMNKLETDSSFVNNILWTDECTFSRTGVVNRQNTHFWSLQNPHVIRPNKHQVRWSVNVWCGIWKGSLVGPFFFDNTLTGKKYVDLLRGPVSDFLDDHVSLADLTKMWFQHDGAPAHKAAPSRTLLRGMFEDNIIGYGGLVEWPPRSPDLNPLDFFLWGFLKSKVYEVESVSRVDLQNRILSAVRCVTPAILRKVEGEFQSRVRLCILVQGKHLEHA